MDFHALRTSFITALALGGVHPKVAQTLARHSSIELTMQVYTRIGQTEQRAGLKALPRLSLSETA